IEPEGGGRDDLEPAGVTFRDLGKRAERALVALDGDLPAGADGDERAREAARSGPDLDHVHAVERPGRARDAGGQVEVEQEVLAERFLGGGTRRAAWRAPGRE